MLHRITLLQRHPALSAPAFSEHWRTRHADIVRRMPGLTHYAQNHVVARGQRPPAEFPVSGVVETWYRSAPHADLAVSAPEAFAALLADERHLLAGSAALQVRASPPPLADAHWKVWLLGSGVGVPALTHTVRKAGTLPGLVQERVLERDAAVPPLTREDLAAPDRPVDGVVALVFGSEDDARAALTSLSDAEAGGGDTPRLQLLLTREHRVR